RNGFSTYFLISTLALAETPFLHGAAVLTSRSSDGVNWSNPYVVAGVGGGQDFDKNWITCDTWQMFDSSPCYTGWDDAGPSANGLIYMSTSTDQGVTWSTA